MKLATLFCRLKSSMFFLLLFDLSCKLHLYSVGVQLRLGRGFYFIFHHILHEMESTVMLYKAKSEQDEKARFQTSLPFQLHTISIFNYCSMRYQWINCKDINQCQYLNFVVNDCHRYFDVTTLITRIVISLNGNVGGFITWSFSKFQYFCTMSKILSKSVYILNTKIS